MARIVAKVIDKDRGYKALKARLEDLKGDENYTKVGVLASTAARKDARGPSNVDLGIIHEFGDPARGIPERSWLRSAFDLFREKWFAFAQIQVKAIIDGRRTVPAALELLGLRAEADVKKHITVGEGIPPPNAPSTIRRKGSSRPLVASAQFVGAITHAVVEKGVEKTEGKA